MMHVFHIHIYNNLVYAGKPEQGDGPFYGHVQKLLCKNSVLGHFLEITIEEELQNMNGITYVHG